MIDQNDLPKSEQEWREKLTSEQYKILRESGTEPPFSGDLLNVKDSGIFQCAGCGQEIFPSDTKYDSGSGWPSFFDTVSPEKVELIDDFSHGMARVEVNCSNCGSHLGHLFFDGPSDKTGKRYCINSAALNFVKQD